MSFVLLHLYYLDQKKQIAVIDKMYRCNIQTYFNEDAVAKSEVDFLLVGAHELNSEYLKKFKRLKCIQVLGNNTSLIDVEYCKKNNIYISYTKYPRGYIIAEHAISLALNFTRNISLADKKVRSYTLSNNEKSIKTTEVDGVDNWCNIPSSTLYHKNIGIIGFGAVGLELNKRLQPFECKVSYFKRQQFSRKTENNLNIQYKPLLEIAKSDIIFVQLGLTDKTIQLINNTILNELKNDAIIINCGRAGVFDESALINKLQKNKQLKVGLDVFWKEPLPLDHALINTSNTILTPHMAECGGEDISKQRIEALDKIIDFSKINTP